MIYFDILKQYIRAHIPVIYIPYVYAIGIFIIIAVVLRIIVGIFVLWCARRAQASKNKLDDILVAVLQTIRPLFYIMFAALIALQTLPLPQSVEGIVQALLLVVLVVQALIALQTLIAHSARTYLLTHEAQEKGQDAALVFGIAVLKGIVWVVGILFLLSNLGVNITSLAASLGIGGVAVALALQSVLEDLFSSFSIYFDKPFEVGDFIIVGDKMGVVEKIGIKTTRLRALQGEQIVISNKELTVAQVQNFKRLEERRVVFSLGVTYDTTQEHMKQIPQIIKSIIDKVDNTRFDRAHFYQFGDSALLFEVVYYLRSADYTEYMDAQQIIHLAIKDEFEKLEIEMAFPTRMVYVKQT